MKNIFIAAFCTLLLFTAQGQMHFGAEIDFGLVGRTLNNKADKQAGYFPFELNIFTGHDNFLNGNLLIGLEVHTHLGRQKFRLVSNDELIKFQQNKFGVFAKYDLMGLFASSSYTQLDHKFAFAALTSVGMNASSLHDVTTEKLTDKSFYWSVGLSTEVNVWDNLRIVIFKPRIFFNKVKDEQNVLGGFNGSVWEINVGAVYTF